MGGDGGLLDEQGESRGASHELELVLTPQLLSERDEVDGLAPLEQAQHGGVDHAMRLGVKVARSQNLDHPR